MACSCGVTVAGEYALDAAACLSGGLAGIEYALVVGGGLGVVADPLKGDDVERPVELAVAAAVEPVALVLAARGVDRTGTGERGKRCLRFSSGWGRRSRRVAGHRRPAPLRIPRAARARPRRRRGESTLGLRHLARKVARRARPTRRRTPFMTSLLGRSRAAARATRSPESAPRRSARGIGSGDQKCAELVEGGVARLHRPAALEQEQAEVLSLPPPRGRLSRPPLSSRRAARAASIRSLLPRLRSWRRGRSHS
jgi:hypothetical protein